MNYRRLKLPRAGSRPPKRNDLLSDWLPRDDPVKIDTIKGELKENANEAIETASLRKSYKKIIKIIGSEDHQDKGKWTKLSHIWTELERTCQFVSEKRQDWIPITVQIKEERETLVAKMQETRQIAQGNLWTLSRERNGRQTY